MVRRLLQLNSTQINWFDSSIGSTCHGTWTTTASFSYFHLELIAVVAYVA